MATKRPKREVENGEFMGFALRILEAAGRRVGTGDIESLPLLLDLADRARLAETTAVIGLRLDHGYSWQEIGDRCGFTRQAAQKRWGEIVAREAGRREWQAELVHQGELPAELVPQPRS